MVISMRGDKKLLLNTLIPLILVLTIVASAQTVLAQTETATNTKIYNSLGAGLAIGLAGMGAGIAVGIAGAAGISALTEKRELFGTVLLIVALGEGIAIYGLIIAVLLII